MQALVLGGGSIKGAFQAGALAEILSRGFAPDVITGISVGALNGAFLTERAGRAAPTAPDWPALGAELVRFWTDNVTRPDDLIARRSTGSIAWGALWSRFDGLVKTDPLRALVRREILEANLRRSPVAFHAGTVNLADGEIVYANLGFPNLLEYIIASTAIPIMMPLSMIGDRPYYDGGLRDIAPLKQAIDAGATEIVCIACQPLRSGAASFNRKNLLHLVDRVVTVMTDEILRNDLELASYINEYCPRDGTRVESGPLRGYRYIPIRIIQPAVPIEVQLDSFTAADIATMLDLGRYAAREVMGRAGG
ncbi:MAG: patatin-like phospholipase family protein [Thermoanaerobaculaceae bacterium]|jgi:NTE family protein|nr:patatin-like phospholipase family protein [Thermoanaerobaculaceae bacterium]